MTASVFHRETLSFHPPGHPDRSESLNNLAVTLSSRLKEVDDLEEVTVLGREALSLPPPRQPDRSMFLKNLALDLSSRYVPLGRICDLNEVIVFSRDSRSTDPKNPHRLVTLGNLAMHLCSLYMQVGGIDDLKEALVLAREEFSLCSLGHPGRSRCLYNLKLSLPLTLTTTV